MIDRYTGIWDLETVKKGGHKHDSLLVKTISDLYHPTSVADLGCGDGWYCKQLRDLGCPKVHGYEGSIEMLENGEYDDIFILDLTKKRWVDIPYDLVLCLEVGEHIPKDHEEVFLDNVSEFAKKASVVVLSWAVPGQKGRGHFNEQPNEYVAEQMERRGFYLSRMETDYLRENSELKWFKNTVMSYGRKRMDS